MSHKANGMNSQLCVGSLDRSLNILIFRLRLFMSTLAELLDQKPQPNTEKHQKKKKKDKKALCGEVETAVLNA